jgi:hypothetical protein
MLVKNTNLYANFHGDGSAGRKGEAICKGRERGGKE